MADEVQIILDLLNTGWTKSNTDSRMPTIDKIFNVKRADFSPYQDYVLGYLLSGSYLIKPLGLGTQERETLVISLDVRTMTSRAHHMKMRDEIMRVIRANKLRDPDVYKFNVIRLERMTDLTDKSTGLYRVVIDVRCEDFRVPC